MHLYAVRPSKDHRGVDLISDALPFGRLWYGEPNAIATQLTTRSFAAVHTMLSFASVGIWEAINFPCPLSAHSFCAPERCQY